MPWWVALVSLLGGLTVGVWLGAYVSVRHTAEEIVRQGFINLYGDRYRVDRVGRKKSGSAA